MIVCVGRGISDRHVETIVAAGATTVDQVEAQLELIKQAGEGNYLARLIKESDA